MPSLEGIEISFKFIEFEKADFWITLVDSGIFIESKFEPNAWVPMVFKTELGSNIIFLIPDSLKDRVFINATDLGISIIFKLVVP